ncbi:MAG TPA: tRNA glutamyl-Q(34) synthetase GluQRS [Polyangiaceae bacterium]|nr:tRNA glutamyl-Q(34) synthetase GluQRS [Polyangiaceae bacterium]
MAPPRGRLAPSPTGQLHLGHARTFVLAWLHVRSRGGELLVRMEDLDASRSRPELAAGILRDLEWLGLDWDGPVVTQSARLDELRAAAATLHATGVAYPCICTRADLRSAVSAPQRGVDELRYAGTCRHRTPSEIGARPFALRFRVPAGAIRFVDGIAGEQSFDVAEEVGDFMIQNRAGVPSYQLAVVVDDDASGVNEVFRGDDLLSSTPRQMLLYDALGLQRPHWYHAPLVLDASGRRLAKRHDDLALATLQSEGVDPRAIVAWAMASAGFDVGERITPNEASALFAIERMRPEPVRLGDDVLCQLRAAR